jgi:hypothetical protein
VNDEEEAEDEGEEGMEYSQDSSNIRKNKNPYGEKKISIGNLSTLGKPGQMQQSSNNPLTTSLGVGAFKPMRQSSGLDTLSVGHNNPFGRIGFGQTQNKLADIVSQTARSEGGKKNPLSNFKAKMQGIKVVEGKT